MITTKTMMMMMMATNMMTMKKTPTVWRFRSENVLSLVSGILAPGGSVNKDARSDGQPGTTEICVFCAKDDSHLKGFANLFVKLIRRYKYLERSLEDAFSKVILFMRSFQPEQRQKLATLSALLFSVGLIPPSVLTQLLQDHMVKDGLAFSFLMDCLKRWAEEKDSATIWSTLRRCQLEQRLLDFMPTAKRNEANLTLALSENGLQALVDIHKAHACLSVKREIQTTVSYMIEDNVSRDKIVEEVTQKCQAHSLNDADIVVLIWNTLMNMKEWNKKEELAAEQSLKYLRQETVLLSAFANSNRAEMALMRAIQEYCYDNINFLKVFQKIVVLLYKNDVLSEDTIHKWYNDGHSQKGKGVFLDQMKSFVEWLKNAEEESEDDDD